MPSIIVRTPDGAIALVPEVVKQLAAAGAVWSEADGWHAKDRATIETMVSEGDCGVCDFCTHGHPIAIFEVADFDMLPGNRSTGGWAACETCAPLVKAEDRDALLKRAIAGSSNPEHVFVQAAITQLHGQFWASYKAGTTSDSALLREGLQASADILGVKGVGAEYVVAAGAGDVALPHPKKPKLSDEGAQLAGALAALKEYLDNTGKRYSFRPNPADSLAHRHERIRKLARRMKVPVDYIERLDAMRTPEDLAAYVRASEHQQDALSRSIHHLTAELDILQRAAGVQNDYRTWGPLPQPFDKARPWMEAIEMQFAALSEMGRAIRRSDPATDELTGLMNDSWRVDQQLLKRAECYTWGIEPLMACRSMARSIPLDSALRLDLLPSKYPGWWYFPGPIPIKTTSWDDSIVALLWGITKTRDQQRAMLSFSTYVVGRVPMPGTEPRTGLHYVPIPTQMWHWYEGETVQAMLDRCGREYDEVATSPETKAMHSRNNSVAFPKADVQRATAELSLFFLAACLWMQHRVMVFEAGHIERHRRKQLHREHKLDVAPNDVKIIQLRRREVVHRPANAGTTVVDWSCRWPVDGHPRNQRYGSGRKETKLIWIDGYVKGPADRPLRVPSHKVYVVDR